MGEYPVNTWQTYSTRSVFVSSGAFDSNQTISGSLRQLARVQSLDWEVPYPVEFANYLDVGSEAYLSSHNPVNITISYYQTNGRNELALGLVDQVGPAGALTLNLDQEKNLYIATQNTPGVDNVSAPTGAPQSIIGMGQSLLTTYSMEGQVGGIIRSNATLNCLTAFSYTGNIGNRIPAVNYQDGSQLTGQFVMPQAFSQYDPNITGYDNPIASAAIGSQDMYLIFPEGTPFSVVFSGAQSCYLQSFNLTLSFDRRELKPLGSVYPPARALFYPIRVDLTTEAIVNRYQQDRLDRIDWLATGQSIYLIVKQPCSNVTLFGFYFDKLQLESQSITTSIGPADAINLKWRGQITSPYTVFCSPAIQFLINEQTQSPWGITW